MREERTLILLLLYYGFCFSPGLASSLPVGTDEDFSGDSSSPAAGSNLLMPYTVSFSDLIIMTTTEQAMAANPTSSIIASIAPTTTELSPSSTSILPMTSSAVQSVQESTHSRTEEATTTPSSSRTDQSRTSVSIAIPSVTPVIFSQTPIVTVTVLNTTSVLVSWSLVDGAIGYRLVIRSQPGVNNIQRSTGAALIIEVDASMMSYIVTNLSVTNNYTIQVVAILSGGIEGPSSTVHSFTTMRDPMVESGLPAVAAAAIAVVCTLLLLILISAIVAAILLVLWRKVKTAECDIEVNGEMVYKSGSGAGDIADLSCETDAPGLQLTAKRWMRANANYSTSSVLLPPMPQLIYSYTAEDVVEANTMVARPVATGLTSISSLAAIPESPTKEDPPQSASSSSERSQEAPSTMSSVCSRSHLEVQRVPPLPEETGEQQLSEDDGQQPLFDMMETVYQASPSEAGSLLKYEMEDSDVTLKEQIGLGESGKVMRGIAKQLPLESECNDVVVTAKILNGETTKDDFIGAAYILSQFSHDNVLRLLGVCTLSPPIMMLVTYMSNGDLKRFLTRVRRRTRIENQQCDIGLIDQTNMAVQIASGMEYLSSKFFLHRALQASYIMVGEDMSLRIGGFRHSRMLAKPNSFDRLKESNKLPIKWMAIETLMEKKFNCYNDVWSFGVVLWEIFSYGLTPYRGIENGDVLGHLQDGRRLTKPSDCPEDVYTLMLHCWNEQKEQRPSFKVLRQHFTNMQAMLSDRTTYTGLSTL